MVNLLLALRVAFTAYTVVQFHSLLEIYLQFTAVIVHPCYSIHSTTQIFRGENPLPLWCRCPSVHRCIIHAVLERDNSDRDWVVRVARSLAPLPHKIRLRDHT